MIVENLSTLKIHKLTQEQFDRELAAGNIDENALYLTPDEGIDTSEFATIEDLAEKADKTHKHVMSDITDLQTTLDASLDELKQYVDEAGTTLLNTTTTNDEAVLSEAQSYIDEAVAGKANSNHTHSFDDVSGLATALGEKVPSSLKINNRELTDDITLVASDIGAAPTSHSHDDRYYTETEIDAKLEVKANTDHEHDKYESKGAAAIVQNNVNALNDTLNGHVSDSSMHVSSDEKEKWNTAYGHSTADHARIDATNVASSSTNGKIKINGVDTKVYEHPGSNVTAGSYTQVTVNAQGHVTGGTNPTTLAGYGITDAETKGAASGALASANSYTDTKLNTKADANHNHDGLYDKINAATAAEARAKEYADDAAEAAAKAVKDDLLNGAGEAYDTLKELGDLIDGNANAIEALESVATGKADKSHGHAITDVSGLQEALNGKAASSHGTHVNFSTTNPAMDGTASVGSATTVARSDHKHPTDTSRAAQADLDSHTSDTTIHITATERTNWNTAKDHANAAHAPAEAEPNQNAFSHVAVGSTIISADSATDTITLAAGDNVTITPDAATDKITISAKDTTYTLSSFGLTATAAELNKMDGVTATTTELNYVDGVTSNIQEQLDAKASSSHTHKYAGSSSSGGAATSANKVNASLTVQLNGGSTEDTNKFTFNGSAAKSVNITPSSIGAAESSHTHDGRYYTETEVDTKLAGKANSSHGNHVPATQTANNATFLRNDNTWQKVTPANIGAAASSHTHQVANISDLTATAAELNYCDGVTSNIQTQLDAKQATITGGATTITSDNLTASRALVSNSSGKVAVSAVTSTELGYLDGVTSNVQTQLDGKASSTHNHSAANITSGTIAAARLPSATGSAAGITVVYPAASCTTFSSDSGTVTPLAVQKGAKMFAITRPSDTTVNAIARFSNTEGDVKNSKILIENVTNTRDTSKTANVLSIPAEGGKKMVYGYCTDQVDGTSFIGGVFDAAATEFPYNAGLAIGGTSGNLLWKGSKVATVSDIPAAYTHPAYTARTGVPTANATPAFGGTFTVSQPVSDATGHITAINSRTITIPSATATTSANGLMTSTDKSKLNNTNIAYGTCSTAAATAAKVVTISGNTNWTLTAGATIVVKFTNTNTAENPTLNVNSTGAKSIWYNTALITTSSLSYAGYASRIATYVYDGTQYVFQGWSLDNNSDTKVTQTVRTTNGEFPLLLRGTSAGTTTTTTTTTFGTKMTANPSTGEVKVATLTAASGITSGGKSVLVEPTAVAGTGAITVALADNSEYTYTAVTSLTMTRGSGDDAWGMITFGTSAPTVSTPSGFAVVAGDDITTATANSVWEFNHHKGYIVFKKWSA